LYFLIVYLLTNSIKKTLIYTYLPFTLFKVGQIYTFVAVPASYIQEAGYARGKVLEFVFSPHSILLMTSISVSFFDLLKRLFLTEEKLKFGVKGILLLLSLVGVISAIKSQYIANLSILYSLLGFGEISFFYIFISYLKDLKKRERFKVINIFLLHLSLVISFLSLIVLFQFVNRSTLGFILESSQEIPISGTDTDFTQFRPIGIFTHANILANTLNTLLFSLLLLWFYLNEKKKLFVRKRVLFVSLIVCGLAILVTLTRAVYLALAVSFLLYIFFDRQIVFNILEKVRSLVKKLRIISLLVGGYLGWIIIQRFVYSLSSFADQGGFFVRDKLFSEAISIFKQNFFWGVGRGMFIPALFRNATIEAREISFTEQNVARYFPEAVHNGFLLFLVEHGFVSFLIILFFFFFLFRRLIRSKLNLKLKVVFLLGFLSQVVVMFFHPFVNFVTLYTLMSLLVIENENDKN